MYSWYSLKLSPQKSLVQLNKNLDNVFYFINRIDNTVEDKTCFRWDIIHHQLYKYEKNKYKQCEKVTRIFKDEGENQKSEIIQAKKGD